MHWCHFKIVHLFITPFFNHVDYSFETFMFTTTMFNFIQQLNIVVYLMVWIFVKIAMPSCLVIGPLWLFFSCWFLILPNLVLKRSASFLVFFPLSSFLASSCKSIPIRSLRVGSLDQYNKMFDKDSILFGRKFNICSTRSFLGTTSLIIAN